MYDDDHADDDGDGKFYELGNQLAISHYLILYLFLSISPFCSKSRYLASLSKTELKINMLQTSLLDVTI